MIDLIFMILAFYLVCGFVFAIIFIFKGLNAIDESAYDSSPGFKIIIIPGTMVFWPLLLKKWVNAAKNSRHD